MSLPFALLALALAGPAAGFASAHGQSNVVGHVYVNDNTTGMNTIAGFDRTLMDRWPPKRDSRSRRWRRHRRGPRLKARFRSPTGDGIWWRSMRSNQLSVLRIQRDGSLRLVRDGVVSSDGVLPVSVAIHDRFVYVANASPVSPNYTGFILGHHGRLYPLAASTVALPDGSQPGDVLFNGTGSKLVATRVGPSDMDRFTVRSNGRLTAAPGSPFAARASARSAASSGQPTRTSFCVKRP